MLVDDHPIVREGLRSLIDGEPDMRVCCEAAETAEAIRMLSDDRPDMVIVDLVLGKGSGLELVKDIHSHWSNLLVLVLSMHDERIFAERVLKAGAKGYVMKDEAPSEILVAIRSVLAGGIYVGKEIVSRIARAYAEGRDGQIASPMERLSDRELEVLQLLGEGMGTRQIATGLHLSPKTIETYRHHLKKKLGLSNASQLLHFAASWVLGDGKP